MTKQEWYMIFSMIKRMKDRARMRKQQEAERMERKRAEVEEKAKREYDAMMADMLSKLCPINEDKCSAQCVHFKLGGYKAAQFLPVQEKYTPVVIRPSCKLWGNYRG